MVPMFHWYYIYCRIDMVLILYSYVHAKHYSSRKCCNLPMVINYFEFLPYNMRYLNDVIPIYFLYKSFMVYFVTHKKEQLFIFMACYSHNKYEQLFILRSVVTNNEINIVLVFFFTPAIDWYPQKLKSCCIILISHSDSILNLSIQEILSLKHGVYNIYIGNKIWLQFSNLESNHTSYAWKENTCNAYMRKYKTKIVNIYIFDTFI